jgi:DNA-directed RNA polymerase specialized sigma24 family protein
MQAASGDRVTHPPDSPQSDGKRKFAEALESPSGAPDVSKSREAEAELTSDRSDAVTRPKRVRYYYDPKRIEEARQLHENNVPLGEIARKLSIQRRTLNRWLGLETDPAQQRERLLQLHHQKVPQREMAKQLDLPLPKVVQLLQEAGLVKKREQAHQRHAKDVREQALQFRDDGVDNAEIAKRLGVPKGTVSSWVTQAGLSAPQKKLDDTEIRALRQEGRTQQEIAETLAVSREAVAKRLKKQGLSAPQVKYSEEQRAKVAELYHQNLKLKDIASNLGIPQGSVGYILNTLGLKNRNKAPMTEQQKQQAIDLRANGHSVQQIVQTLGFSQHTISKVTYQPQKKQKTAESSDAE